MFPFLSIPSRQRLFPTEAGLFAEGSLFSLFSGAVIDLSFC